MAGSQDFEARRRERLRKQRKQRQRMRIIRSIALIVVLVLLVSVVMLCVSKCKNDETAVGNDNITATLSPTEPVVTSIAPLSVPDIPAPAVGDNNLLDVIMRSGEVKHAYLTFDDGPNETITPQILDVLRRYNVKATFFMMGKYIEQYPHMCARVIEEGHLAAPHSYSHEYPVVYSSPSKFMEEMEKTYQLIVDNTPGGKEPFKVVRFPSGSFNDANYGPEKQECKSYLAEKGFYFCDWNSLTGDAEGKQKNASELLDYFNMYRPSTNNLVVLMHDTLGKQATADMLASLIEQLLSEGYTLGRLDEIDFTSPVTAQPGPTGGADHNSDALEPEGESENTDNDPYEDPDSSPAPSRRSSDAASSQSSRGASSGSSSSSSGSGSSSGNSSVSRDRSDSSDDTSYSSSASSSDRDVYESEASDSRSEGSSGSDDDVSSGGTRTGSSSGSASSRNNVIDVE